MKKQIILTLAIAAGIVITCTVAVRAKTVTPPSKPEFSAYEATLEKGDSGIKKVVVLQDNKRHQEFILVPGYGMIFRWQDARKIGE
jgi:ActR/RegA family two-component response regulator